MFSGVDRMYERSERCAGPDMRRLAAACRKVPLALRRPIPVASKPYMGDSRARPRGCLSSPFITTGLGSPGPLLHGPELLDSQVAVSRDVGRGLRGRTWRGWPEPAAPGAPPRRPRSWSLGRGVTCWCEQPTVERRDPQITCPASGVREAAIARARPKDLGPVRVARQRSRRPSML